MPGFQVHDPAWTISLHDRPLLKAHKQLPRRRDVALRQTHKPHPIKIASLRNIPRAASLEETYKSPVAQSKSSTPAAPLTPPNGPQDGSENDVSTSPSVETMIPIQRSPRPPPLTPVRSRELPTPDATPPRPSHIVQRPSFVTQQSMLSSRAESFKTAREELTSDGETDRSNSPPHDESQLVWQPPMRFGQLEDHSSQPTSPADLDSLTPTKQPRISEYLEHVTPIKEPDTVRTKSPNRPRQTSARHDHLPAEQFGGLEHVHSLKRNVEQKVGEHMSTESDYSANFEATPHKRLPHRRRMPKDSYEPPISPVARPTRDQVHQDSDWSLLPETPDSVDEKVNSWRLSGISTTSTVEAIVVDNPPPRRAQKLRHRIKNASLRSASSPIPQANRDSWNSTTSADSPHRLVHKPRRISDYNRWSQNSDMSKEISTSSAISRPQPETPYIPVVVIPQRKSSLKSSTSSSRRHSLSSVTGHPTTTQDQQTGYFDRMPQRERALSDSLHSRPSSHERRDRHFPPVVPVRTSSISAPTSRNHSRSSSMNSESLRQQRRAAEADVRRTLARMESETPSVQSKSMTLLIQGNAESPPHQTDYGLTPPAPSQTPFSQPSFLSASPGPFEISEATAVNLFAHNNHSLQLIDRKVQPESQAVSRIRSTWKEDDPLETGPETPRMSQQTNNPVVLVDSPLRNPRDPPLPPAFKIIPPTPAALSPSDEYDKQLGLRQTTSDGRAGMRRRLGSLKRAWSTRRHSDSFIPALTRGLSLKNARNRRADEDFDDKLHPFWKPRGFWDDFSDSESESGYDDDDEEDIIVHNSLGIPQKRIIFDGPISLVRRIPNPLAKNRQAHHHGAIIKKASYGSLSRAGWLPGRRIYTIPGLGYRFQMLRLTEMQERLRHARVQREMQRREQRRESLRRKIGPNIIPNGDSRFV